MIDKAQEFFTQCMFGTDVHPGEVEELLRAHRLLNTFSTLGRRELKSLWTDYLTEGLMFAKTPIERRCKGEYEEN